MNGSPTKKFTPDRGLRQGDPISPLLFNLVCEILSKILNKACSAGIINGVYLAVNEGNISHVQFTNDTLIFIKNSLHSLEGIQNILLCFQFVSGLKTNFSKNLKFLVKHKV